MPQGRTEHLAWRSNVNAEGIGLRVGAAAVDLVAIDMDREYDVLARRLASKRWHSMGRGDQVFAMRSGTLLSDKLFVWFAS